MAAMKLAEGLAKAEHRISKHMNEDHGASVLAYAHHFAGMPTAVAATMSGINTEGFLLTVELPNGDVKEGVLAPFSAPLATAAGVRKVAVAMHHEAFRELGFAYRLSRGYYQNAMIIHHTGGAKVWIPAGVAVVAAVAYAIARAKRT